MEFVNLASQKTIILAPITKYCQRLTAINGFVMGYGVTNTSEINKRIGMIADDNRGLFGNRTERTSGMDMNASPISR